VTLGLGSVIASVVEVAPWFATVGRHKPLLFGGSAVLLVLNYWLVVVGPRACAPGQLCHMDSPFMRFNRRLYWISIALYCFAVAITYGGLVVIRWIDASSR
jgi:hypothetical protein